MLLMAAMKKVNCIFHSIVNKKHIRVINATELFYIQVRTTDDWMRHNLCWQQMSPKWCLSCLRLKWIPNGIADETITHPCTAPLSVTRQRAHRTLNVIMPMRQFMPGVIKVIKKLILTVNLDRLIHWPLYQFGLLSSNIFIHWWADCMQYKWKL